MSSLKPNIFISYAWEDRAKACQLHTALKSFSIDVWIDYSGVRAGDIFPKPLSDAIEKCNVILLVWSKSASKSNWVEREWSAALSLNKKVIPCIFDKTALPTILNSTAWIDFHVFKKGLGQLFYCLDITGAIEVKRANPKRRIFFWIFSSFVIIATIIALATMIFIHLFKKPSAPPNSIQNTEGLVQPLKPKSIVKTNKVSHDLSLVDIVVIDRPAAIEEFRKEWLISSASDSLGFPLIDIKLLNPGTQTVYLKQLNFNYRRLSYEGKITLCSPVAPTWEYNVLFDPESQDGNGTLKLSQEIKPNNTDRFIIIVGQMWEALAKYEVDITLLFNENDFLELGKHTILIEGPPCGIGEQLDSVIRKR